LDSDGDGLSDEAETGRFGTDPNRAGTDGDGVSDGEEILVYFSDPTPPPARPPRLEIELADDTVILRWPTNPPGFTLETAAGKRKRL